MNRPNQASWITSETPGVRKVPSTESTDDFKSCDVKINSFSSVVNNKANSLNRWEDNREEQSISRGSKDRNDRTEVGKPDDGKEMVSVAQRVNRYETPKINNRSGQPFGHSAHQERSSIAPLKEKAKECKEIELHKIIKSQAEDLECVEKQLSQAKATVEQLTRKLQQYEQGGKRSPPGSPNEVEVLRKTLLGKNAQIERQDNLIQQLQSELENEAKVHEIQVDEMMEENLELKQKLKDQAETNAVRSKYLQESISQLEDIGKPETMVSLEQEQEDLKKIILEMTSKQEEMESMLLRRTQQSHEWKRRALDAENRLGLTESSESIPTDINGQGSYLQEAMDRQAQTKRSGRLWSVFGKGREGP